MDNSSKRRVENLFEQIFFVEGKPTGKTRFTSDFNLDRCHTLEVIAFVFALVIFIISKSS